MLCKLIGLVVVFSAILASAGFAEDDPPKATAPVPRRLPGMQAGGQILLPTQWSLKPAGEQVKLGDFPVNIALHPARPWAAILHAGYGEHQVMIVDLERRKVHSRVALNQSFYGLCFSGDGTRLYASGAEDEVVHSFTFEDGYLSAPAKFKIAELNEKYVPAGLACSVDGRALYVACPWGNTLCIVPLDTPEKSEHIAVGDDSYPYAALPSRDGQRLFISLWGKAGVAVLNLESRTVEATWPTEKHPTEMALSPRQDLLYVACANSNAVTVLDTETGRSLEVISSALYPRAEKGSTPNSLSLSADGKVLLVANADNNNLAMFNV